ncbi:hypothetical protein QR680_006408 [Steinernema hermaphroditum]|uniref:Uncharacterized protein n=1 Tax=Steinernema hermaphroditum TaxID=289476 RepID=A0AA39HWV8_9BILA|nr:hypothetical protein QR680_006408 [Steinernema hermaphroditum]
MRSEWAVVLLLSCSVVNGRLLHTALGGMHINDCSDTNMMELRNNYFHAISCLGFIRLPMGHYTLQGMNDEIDRIFSEEQKKRGPCEKTGILVRLFYVDENTLVFLRYPDFTRQRETNFDATVASWFVNVRDAEIGEFIPFPMKEEWNVLGTGYERTSRDCKYVKKGKAGDRKMCDPKAWYFNIGRRQFEYELYDNNLIPFTDPLMARDRPMGIKLDGRDREIVYTTHSYEGHSLRSYQDGKDRQQYYCIFNRRDPERVEAYKKGLIEKMYDSKLCLLRTYRYDLGELPEAYILPGSSKKAFHFAVDNTNNNNHHYFIVDDHDHHYQHHYYTADYYDHHHNNKHHHFVVDDHHDYYQHHYCAANYYDHHHNNKHHYFAVDDHDQHYQHDHYVTDYYDHHHNNKHHHFVVDGHHDYYQHHYCAANYYDHHHNNKHHYYAATDDDGR